MRFTVIYPDEKLQILEYIFNFIGEGISLGWYGDTEESPLLTNKISQNMVNTLWFIILKSTIRDVLSHIRFIQWFNYFPPDGTYGISMLCLRTFEEALKYLEFVEIKTEGNRRRLLSEVVKI